MGNNTTTEVDIKGFHDVANIFPMMGDDDYSELLEDIRAHGLREPIWLHQGKIIDGRNRYRACRQLSIVPTYREWDGRGSLTSFVISLNLKRRHLTSSQKAMIALEIEQLLAEEAKEKERQRKSTLEMFPKSEVEPIHAAKQSAALVGTNGHYITDAKKIVERAPELKEAVLNGSLTISDAKAIASVSDGRQRAIVLDKVVRQRMKPKAAILSQKKAERDIQARAALTKPHIDMASYAAWLPAAPECDLLITDPPYSTDIADIDAFAQGWLPLALSKVRSTGRAYVCIGAYPQELLAYLSVQTPLKLHQVLVWSYKNTLGPAPVHDYKQSWQAILYYVGEDAPALNCPLMTEQFSVQEVNAPDGRMGDRYHAWQKPEALADMFILHSSKPGDIILDCFAGTGTFLLSAHRLNRIALGCDISKAMLQIAEQRGCHVEY